MAYTIQIRCLNAVVVIRHHPGAGEPRSARAEKVIPDCFEAAPRELIDTPGLRELASFHRPSRSRYRIGLKYDTVDVHATLRVGEYRHGYAEDFARERRVYTIEVVWLEDKARIRQIEML